MNNTNSSFDTLLAEIVSTENYQKTEVIQSLWSGYGEIARYQIRPPLTGRKGAFVVKHIQPPKVENHPRGWSGETSHQRKISSYNVEAHFYQYWANNIKPKCALPQYIGQANLSKSSFAKMIVMSDLDYEGFPRRLATASVEQAKVCLRWLAQFHAINLQYQPDATWPQDLWPIGSYWHLSTREAEHKSMQDSPLKQAAAILDEKLNSINFKTLVHGDAKIANFCFSTDLTKVAAVDFQYVGGGCGVKDVIYFLGSCLNEAVLSQEFDQLIDYYFTELNSALSKTKMAKHINHVEQEWRPLVCIAWADFERFLAGWAPTHVKRTHFSHQLTLKALASLSNR
ncbi:phosphotransferase [Shewanella youngdeokensis]|uniref:Phosphotransferase n=1 Tax=Shewanella youngdeokensis TaxID=2999068 RepID=A0ABZ0K2T9_9GAMM|nr:phosphotransferase [Shewanella sp. DAU334]